MKKKTFYIMFTVYTLSLVIVNLFLNTLQPDYRNLFPSNIASFRNIAACYYIALSFMLTIWYLLERKPKTLEVNHE